MDDDSMSVSSDGESNPSATWDFLCANREVIASILINAGLESAGRAPAAQPAAEAQPMPSTSGQASSSTSIEQGVKRIIPPTLAEVEAKKRKLEADKEVKRLTLEQLNIYKPGQCMKYVRLEIHPTLESAWYMTDLPRELQACGGRLYTTPTVLHPKLIVWTRLTPQQVTTENGQMKLTSVKKFCGMSLYVCTVDEVIERLVNKTLMDHIGSLRAAIKGELSVVVFGDYKTLDNRKTLKGKKTYKDYQMAQIKIDLLIAHGVDVHFIENTADLALWITQITKSVAEAPFKKRKRDIEYSSATFYMKGDNKKCVAVSKEGQGIGRLWQQMLSVLPSASLEISRAICSKYKTPDCLIGALDEPKGVAKLAKLCVVRAGGPEVKSRRLGPEFARRLHLLYSSRDGNNVVD